MADFPITIDGSRVSPLEGKHGYTHKFTVKYTDIDDDAATGATDTVTVTLGTTPTKWLVTKAVANVTTAFAGTGAMTLKVGATDDDFAIPATSILTAGIIQPTTGANTVAAPAGATGTSSQTLKAIFTNATSGSPSALTAGEVDIYLCILDTSEDLG